MVHQPQVTIPAQQTKARAIPERVGLSIRISFETRIDICCRNFHAGEVLEN